MNTSVASTFWLLWKMLPDQGYTNTSAHSVNSFGYVLNHVVILCLPFWGAAILFFTVAAPSYIPTNSTQRFPVRLSLFCKLGLIHPPPQVQVTADTALLALVSITCGSPGDGMCSHYTPSSSRFLPWQALSFHTHSSHPSGAGHLPGWGLGLWTAPSMTPHWGLPM